MLTIREVWYGQRSLAQTFWGWHFLLGNIIIGGIGGFIAISTSEANNTIFPLTLYMALTLPYSILIWVGLWRSATNNPGFWAGVVKFILIINIPLAIYQWIQMFLSSSIHDFLALI